MEFFFVEALSRLFEHHLNHSGAGRVDNPRSGIDVIPTFKPTFDHVTAWLPGLKSQTLMEPVDSQILLKLGNPAFQFWQEPAIKVATSVGIGPIGIGRSTSLRPPAFRLVL